MKRLCQPLLLFLLLASVASPQSKDFWAKKDYREWTDKECRKLLADSPWANHYTLGKVFIDSLQTDSSDRERQQNPTIEYKVQIRSAVPVRQALVRLSQINAKYDEMTEDGRKAFDQNAEKFLSGRDPELVVMHVNYSANVQNDDRDLSRHWRLQTTETLKNFTYLIGGGGVKVPLTMYRPGDGAAREFQFVFPRQHNQRPVVGPGDKTLMLEFNHPNIRGTATRILVQFKVEKMMIAGVVVY
jgi:hypothetical protein